MTIKSLIKKAKKKLLILWEKLQQDKRLIFVVVLIGAACLYIDAAYIVRFQMKGIGEARRKVATFRKDIANFKRDFANIETYKKTQAQALAKAKKFVNETQKQLLIQEIYDISNATRVRIEQLRPQLSSKQKDEVVANVCLSPFAVTMELTCGYHQLGRFLNALENGKYFCAVTEMRINGKDGDPFRHSVTLSVVTYAKKG